MHKANSTLKTTVDSKARVMPKTGFGYRTILVNCYASLKCFN